MSVPTGGRKGNRRCRPKPTTSASRPASNASWRSARSSASSDTSSVDLSPAAVALAGQERDALRRRIEAIDLELQPRAVKGLVNALFDAVALGRLRQATADLAEARTELRLAAQPVPSPQVQRSRKAAQRECAALAGILRQVSARFGSIGSGLVFFPQFKAVAIVDSIRAAEIELAKMSDPANWDLLPEAAPGTGAPVVELAEVR